MDKSKSSFIQDMLSVDVELALQISELCTYKEYAPTSILNQVEVVNNKGMFLTEGACKYSYIGKSGNEIIFHFIHAPNFVPYTLAGFFLNEAAFASCVSITPIKGYEISSNKLLPFFAQSPQLYESYYSKTIKMHQLMQSKEICITQYSSTKRYQEFTKMFSEIIDVIPLKDIASYLNIHPGSLSRIRKNLSS